MSISALGIPLAWPSIPLPGYREHPTKYATYSEFAYEALPPVERTLDEQLAWLLAEPPVPNSLGGGHIYDGDPVRAATGQELDALVDGARIDLPVSFSTFIRNPAPRTRVRSCTACYLDLGNFPVSVEGHGWLVHFLSDQQWVGHWYLYVDEDGAEAVVWAFAPYGFELPGNDEPEWAPDFDPRRSGVYPPSASNAVVCAKSFSEFLYRFWIENEIWYALKDPDGPARGLTDEQRRYAEHYLSTGYP